MPKGATSFLLSCSVVSSVGKTKEAKCTCGSPSVISRALAPLPSLVGSARRLLTPGPEPTLRGEQGSAGPARSRRQPGARLALAVASTGPGTRERARAGGVQLGSHQVQGRRITEVPW